MKLITQTIEKQFASIGSQEHIADPIVIAKFFNPTGPGTWHATEYDPITKVCFGYVQLLDNEWGYFSVAELESVKCPPFGLPIERDLHCGLNPISKHCHELASTIQRRQELIDQEQKRQDEQNIDLER